MRFRHSKALESSGRYIWPVLVLSLIILVPRLASSADKVRLVYTTLSATMAPAWVAKDKSYFNDHGLDVDFVYTGTIPGVQALLAGETQFIYTAGPNLMAARRRGADVVIIGCTAHYNPYGIAARPDIKDASQLIGKRLAVNRLGDTSHLSAVVGLRVLGIEPESITFMQVGSSPERSIALHTGVVEAAIVDEESFANLRRQGMNLLVNLNARRIPYANSCVGVSEGYIRANFQRAEALMLGLAKGNAYVRIGNPQEVMATIAKYTRRKVTDIRVKESYELFSAQNPKHPLVPRDGVVSILNMFAATDKAWLAWKPEQFYTTTVIDKLQQQGLLDKIYDELK